MRGRTGRSRTWWLAAAALWPLACAGCPSSSSREPAQSEGSGRAEEGETDWSPPAKRASRPAAEEREERRPAKAAEPSEPAEAEEGSEDAEEAEAAEPEPAAEAAEPAAPAGVELVEREGLRVRRLVLARSVEDREPVDPATSFSAAGGGRVYAFVEVDNPAREATELTIAWASADSGEERGATSVSVGAMPRWRTWAFTAVGRHRGPMVAVVRDSEGTLLGRAPFEVTP